MMSSWELLALAILALLIFGPERLPRMARTAGRTISRLRREANATLDELKKATEYQEIRRSANLDELRGLAGDLRAEADALTAEADGMTAAVEAGGDNGADRSDRPAPFDPDAT